MIRAALIVRRAAAIFEDGDALKLDDGSLIKVTELGSLNGGRPLVDTSAR
jgi:hypothetical protein